MYLKMMPIFSIDKGSVQEHLFEVLEVFGVVVLHEGVVVVEGDAGVLRVSAYVDDLAAFIEDVRRKHGEWEMTLDNTRRGQSEKKKESFHDYK